MLDLPRVRPSLVSTQGSFSYLQNLARYQHEKPYFYSGPLEPDDEARRTNLAFAEQTVTVKDLRGHERGLDVERHGFEFLLHRSGLELSSPRTEDATHAYIDETCRLAQSRLKAEKVFCYDFRLRLDAACPSGYEESVGSWATVPDEPTRTPHTDHTVEGGPRRVRRHLLDTEAEQFATGKYRTRIVNAWRPLVHAVQTAPIAICDFRSVRAGDLVAADRVSDEYAGEVNYLLHNGDQEWYCLGRQTPDEVLLFTSYDSHPRDGPPFCPHASFRCAVDAAAQPRQSVEVRMIVFTRLD